MDITGKGITLGIILAPEQTVGCWHQLGANWVWAQQEIQGLKEAAGTAL